MPRALDLLTDDEDDRRAPCVECGAAPGDCEHEMFAYDEFTDMEDHIDDD